MNRCLLTWFALVLLVCPGPASSQELVSFQFPEVQAARRTWEAKAGAEPVRVVPGGVLFSCPFRSSVERFYWDAEFSLDLSHATSLLLDVTPVDADACRTFSVYLKSGAGWYHWSRPIRGVGRRQVQLLRSDFGAEGSPLGWNRIDGIRIAPWKARDESAGFILHGLTGRRDAILIVQASSSTTSSSERAISQQAARRISDFLGGMNIPHGSTDDHGVIGGALKGSTLAILCYNPNPPAEEIRALQSYLNTGGKLIVFYSASAELARMMGLRLGSYSLSEEPGRWASITFLDPTRWGVPRTVHDTAWNLIPAIPLDSRSAVIATWSNAHGKQLSDSACVAGPYGLWFPHVMRGEDPPGKERMLLGLIGRYVPSVWAEAARHRMTSAGILAGENSLPTSLRRLEREASGGTRAAVTAELDAARAAHRGMTRAYASGQYPEAIAQSDRLELAVLRAHGMNQRRPQGEMRVIWDHDGVGLYPGDWPRTCRELSRAGINTVFANILWGGKAHYPSRVVPVSKTHAMFGDQADQCVRAGHAVGMEVHAWKVCWNLENASGDFVTALRREGRLQQAADGSQRDWMCPSHPENRRLELAAIRELVTRYPVDGVHLDYIRYPSAHHCFCRTSRKAFETSLGYPVRNWPQGVQMGGSLEATWQTWRAEEMTRQVRDIRQTLNGVRPGLKLSAAVYRMYPSCRASIGQDWGRWLKEGLVDFVCPMTYAEDLSNFRAETEGHLGIDGARGRIVPGIGVLTSESRLSPDQVIAQINICRELKTPGFALFDLSPTLRDRLLPILTLGEPGP